MSSSDRPKRSVLTIKPEAGEKKQGPVGRPPVRGRHQAPKRPTLTAKTEQAAAQLDILPPRRREKPDQAAERKPERPPRQDKRPRRPGKPGPRAAERWHFFAPCPRGLEAELLKEIVDLGAEEALPAAGGVAFRGGMSLGWKVNLWSRLAIRVLWRVTEGRYLVEDDLYRGALNVDWPDLFDVTRTLAVTTVGRNSPLKSLNIVSLKIKDAICDRFREAIGARPSVDTREPAVPLVAYLTAERYSIYVDLSGEPLNRRGYRVQAATAPLNENLAAGILKLAGWRPDVPLYDPMMGGGTLLLEAGLMALNIAPGLKRHFAFENLKNFDRVEWQRLRKDAQAAMVDPRPLPIYGSDIDPLMVRAAGLNLKAAGLLDWVRIMEADFFNVNPPTPSGLIVSNPPYGVRLSTGDMAGFHRSIGDNLKQHFPNWTAYLLSADPEFPKQVGLKASRRTPLFNGPLECRLYEYRLVAGSHRKA